MALCKAPPVRTLPTDVWRHTADFLTPVELFRLGCTSREFHRLRREALPPLVRRRIAALLRRRAGLTLPAPWPRGLRLSGSLVYHALTQDAGTHWVPGAPNFYLPHTVAPVFPPGQHALAHTQAVGESPQTGTCCAGHASAVQRVHDWLGTHGLVCIGAKQEEDAHQYTPTVGLLYFAPPAALENHLARLLPTLRRLWLDVELGLLLPPERRVMHCCERTSASLHLAVVTQEGPLQFDLPVLENFFDGHGLHVAHPAALVAGECQCRWPNTSFVTHRMELYRGRGLRVLDAEGPVGTRNRKRKAE